MKDMAMFLFVCLSVWFVVEIVANP